MIEQVLTKGEEVIINKAGRPVARLTRFAPAKQQRKLGLFQGQIKVAKEKEVCQKKRFARHLQA